LVNAVADEHGMVGRPQEYALDAFMLETKERSASPRTVRR
jgi:hypothetical protein